QIRAISARRQNPKIGVAQLAGVTDNLPLFRQGGYKAARVAEPECFVKARMAKVCVDDANAARHLRAHSTTAPAPVPSAAYTTLNSGKYHGARAIHAGREKNPVNQTDRFLAARAFKPQLQPSTSRDRRARVRWRNRSGVRGEFRKRLGIGGEQAARF